MTLEGTSPDGKRALATGPLVAWLACEKARFLFVTSCWDFSAGARGQGRAAGSALGEQAARASPRSIYVHAALRMVAL